MWTFNKIALAALLLLLSAAAHGDGISGNGIHGGITDGIGGNGGFTGVAPVACGTGVINFSTGCTQGMFGGL